MLRPWLRGITRRHLAVSLISLIALGVGWAFGTRVLDIRRVRADLHRLHLREAASHEEIQLLARRLGDASSAQTVELEARRQLRWGFPDEERIVLIWR